MKRYEKLINDLRHSRMTGQSLLSTLVINSMCRPKQIDINKLTMKLIVLILGHCIYTRYYTDISVASSNIIIRQFPRLRTVEEAYERIELDAIFSSAEVIVSLGICFVLSAIFKQSFPRIVSPFFGSQNFDKKKSDRKTL
jgi:hypothetical protein